MEIEVDALPVNFLAEDAINLKAKSEKLVEFPVDKIVVKIDRNRRDDLKSYDPEKNPDLKKMVRSMKDDGWIPGSFPYLHQNTIEVNGNKDIEVLIGHIRVTAAKLAGLPKIPAILATGLTEAEKLLVVMSPPEQSAEEIGHFKEYKALKGSMGDARIADRIRVTKNKIQEFRALDALPVEAQEMFFQYHRGVKMPFPMGRKAILALNAARLRDAKGTTLDESGIETPEEKPVRLPDRNPLGGVEYHTQLAKFKKDGVKDGPSVTAKSLADQADGIKSTVVRDLIYGLAGTKGFDPSATKLKAIDMTTKYQLLLDLKIQQPHLAALINVPETGSTVDDVQRADDLAKFIATAVEEYTILFPDRDPLPKWAIADVNKPVVKVDYEGTLPPEEVPPIDVEVKEESPVTQVHSEVTTEVRSDSPELVGSRKSRNRR